MTLSVAQQQRLADLVNEPFHTHTKGGIGRALALEHLLSRRNHTEKKQRIETLLQIGARVDLLEPYKALFYMRDDQDTLTLFYGHHTSNLFLVDKSNPPDICLLIVCLQSLIVCP
jgi:hypothetical protein